MFYIKNLDHESKRALTFEAFDEMHKFEIRISKFETNSKSEYSNFLNASCRHAVTDLLF